jgi:hypothetical protein
MIAAQPVKVARRKYRSGALAQKQFDYAGESRMLGTGRHHYLV